MHVNTLVLLKVGLTYLNYVMGIELFLHVYKLVELERDMRMLHLPRPALSGSRVEVGRIKVEEG